MANCLSSATDVFLPIWKDVQQRNLPIKMRKQKQSDCDFERHPQMISLSEIQIDEETQMEILMAMENANRMEAQKSFSFQGKSTRYELTNSHLEFPNEQGNSRPEFKKQAGINKDDSQQIQQDMITFILETKNKKCLECPICLTETGLKDTGVLSCGHYFHRSCILAHLKATIDSNNLKIKCPEEDCDLLISLSDLQEFSDANLMKKYLDMTFQEYISQNNKDTSWCPTANCSTVFVYDAGITIYSCPGCEKTYCLSCRSPYHNGMTCAEYRITNVRDQNDVKFDQFVKGAKCKQCPQCTFWVDKKQGCNHMTCICKKDFCYVCGNDYPHPSGKCKGPS